MWIFMWDPIACFSGASVFCYHRIPPWPASTWRWGCLWSTVHWMIFCGTYISLCGSFCNRQGVVRPVSSSTGPPAYNNGRRKVVHHMLHEILLYLALILLHPLGSDYYENTMLLNAHMVLVLLSYHSLACLCFAGSSNTTVKLHSFWSESIKGWLSGKGHGLP